jgi:hypothetical protein
VSMVKRMKMEAVKQLMHWFRIAFKT